MRALGRIEGQLDGIKTIQSEQGTTIRSIDKRVRKVEIKASINGATAGGLMGIGVSLLVAKVKAMTGV